jgi:hypothetical protein
MTDWIAAHDTSDYNEMFHHLKEIVETWQAIMLYSSAGVTTFAEIPDLNLQSVGTAINRFVWESYFLQVLQIITNFL